jgi:hypothetical protein
MSDAREQLIRTICGHALCDLKRATDTADAILALHEGERKALAEAPDDDDNTMRDDPMFNRGVEHVVNLLSKTLEPLGPWYSGDGSEDYDCDLEETLRNILAAKGLYDKETGEFAAPQSPPGCDAEGLAKALFDARHQGLSNCLDWEDSDIDRSGDRVYYLTLAKNLLTDYEVRKRPAAPDTEGR